MHKLAKPKPIASPRASAPLRTADAQGISSTHSIPKLRGAPANSAELLSLQPVIGNAAIARAIAASGPIQRKSKKKKSPTSLKVGKPESATYPVEATTLHEANDIISALEEAGETTWDPQHNLSYDEDGIVTEAHITVTIKITMPSWPGAKKLKKPARKEWKRFYKALEAHENGHVELVRERLEGVAERMIGLTEEAANTIFSTAVQQLQEASDAYDEATGHGLNTGTVLNLSVEPAPEEEPAPTGEDE